MNELTDEFNGEFPDDEPDEGRFLEMAEAAFATIPEELRAHVKGISFHIEDFADDDILDDMEIDDEYELLGLYQGTSLGQASIGDVRQDLNRIFLYREPILDYCDETGETVEWVIRHVLIHEIGHHFGLSDEDMERIEQEGEGEAENDMADHDTAKKHED
jgi:predicted Zn-dependent protease with MMP-like domain